MGNRSRMGYRHRNHVDPEPEVPPTPEEQAEMDATADAFAAMESNPRSGIDKLMGLMLRDRDRQLAEPSPIVARAIADNAAATERSVSSIITGGQEPAWRHEPTAYEAAVLHALGNRVTTIDRSHVGGRPMVVPVDIASGGTFMGTADTRRVARDRAANKRARSARSGRTRRHYGSVYRSRFGWPVLVPGISAGIGIDGVVDAEVVDA